MLQNVISYPSMADQTAVAIFWSGNEIPMLNAVARTRSETTCGHVERAFHSPAVPQLDQSDRVCHDVLRS